MTAPVKETDKKAPPRPMRPFRVGAQSVDDEAFERTLTLNAGNQPLDQYNVPSSSFLQELELYVKATTSGNAATVAFKEDAPYCVIESLNFLDTGNSDIITQITGYDLAVINKFGGYKFSDDPKSSPLYSATTGSGATGGSFSFMLRIPIELVSRDALGPLPNKSASTPFKVKTTVAATGSVYSTAPTTPPSVLFQFVPVSYWEPTEQDGSGNPVAQQPPAMGTSQFWNKTPYSNISAGPWTQQLDNAVGYPIRNIVFILRDSTGSRVQGEADFPDPFKMQLQSNIPVNRRKTTWQDRIAKAYGYDTIGDAKNQKDNGVYILWYNGDFAHKPGWENRRGYLRTTDGMRLEAKGTIGGSGAHSMQVLVNYVSPAAGTSLAQITT
ncbi:hypothetical protein OG559_31135 (plasmid) [Micromonospora sp. NBC_01405]|uniref:hypothetical protein n=1 Tax=Micromonospora sp. NBC_01405 TaxID=2903589 RepID=UPI0032566A0E